MWLAPHNSSEGRSEPVEGDIMKEHHEPQLRAVPREMLSSESWKSGFWEGCRGCRGETSSVIIDEYYWLDLKCGVSTYHLGIVWCPHIAVRQRLVYTSLFFFKHLRCIWCIQSYQKMRSELKILMNDTYLRFVATQQLYRLALIPAATIH